MPIFDLGNSVKAEQRIKAPLENAYELAKRILLAYKRDGYEVRFPRENPPGQLEGSFAKGKTRIKADVKLSDAGQGASKLVIQLTGKVEVGGLKGAVATDAMVQDAAKEMLIKEIRDALKKNGLAAALGAIVESDRIYYAYANTGRSGRSYA